MSSTHEAKLTIKADVADASRKMHDLEMAVQKLEKAMVKKAKASRDAAQATDTVGGKMLSVGSKVADLATGLMAATSMLDDFGRRSASMASVTANFSGNIDGLRAATRGLVTDLDLMKASNSAQILGVTKTNDEFERLAAAATKLGAAVGIEATQSIENVTEALGKGSTEVLNNIGVILKTSDAHERYAQQLGITVDKLTDAQKAEAFRVIGMQEVIKKANEATEAEARMGEGIASLVVLSKNAVDNLGLLDRHISDLAREMALAAEDGSVLAQMFDTLTFQAGSTRLELERTLKVLSEANAREAAAEDRLDEMLEESKLKKIELATLDDRIFAQRYADGERTEFILRRKAELQKEYAGSIMITNQALSLLDSEARKDAYGKLKKGLEQLPRAKKAGRGRGRADVMESAVTAPDVSDLLDTGAGPSEATMLAEQRVKAAERQLQLETAQEASLERRWQLQTKIFEAEMAMIDQRLLGAGTPQEAAEIQEQQDQLLHDRAVARAEHQVALAAKRAKAEEDAQRRIQQAHARTAKAINDASSLTGSAIQGVADIAMTASEQHGESAEKAERKRRAWGAGILAVDAIFYGAKSAAAFAALNPIEGAGFLSAAIISTAKAIQLGGSVSGVGGGGRGGGGAGGMTERGPIQRERSAGPASKVPGTAGSPSALPAGQRATGSTVVYVNTQVLGSIDETSAVKIQRGLEDAMRSGRIRTGRPS